jgi:membrane protease YdiL (CAAX protease family)
MGRHMSDEPTPPPIEEPPVIVAPPRRPRSAIGWAVSGLMLLIFTINAVGGYVGKPEGEKSYAGLQQTLEYNLSIGESGAAGPFGKVFKDSKKQGLEDVLERANEGAAESEEAARIAVVTALELKQTPPDQALRMLERGKDESSAAIAHAFDTGTTTPEEAAVLDSVESSEFAVRLAKVQAKERAGLESGRDGLVDESLFAKFTVVGLAGMGVLGAGVVALVAFLVMRSSGRLVAVGILGFEKSDGDRYMLRFALYMLAFVGVGTVAALVARDDRFDPAWESWLQAGSLLATFAAVALLLRVPTLDRDDSLTRVFSGVRPFWRNFRAGVFGYLCTVPLLAVALALIAVMSRFLPEPSHPITEEIARAGSLDWLAILLTAAVLAPLVEELAFRGLLFPALATQMRPVAAMLVCGLLFAAIHPQGPLAWPALATTGFAAAALRWHTGSLVPSIVLHMCHNGAILTVAYLIG